ncbi:MAG: TolC family protein [Deltaproteobacteria bacterium]|nr:TolC family protein [Deltaproteobacteria bacterium]
MIREVMGKLTLILAWLVLPVHGFSALTLESYLQQVREKHGGWAAARATSEGALLRAGEASLLVKPALFSTLSYLNDAKPTANSAFLGSKTLYYGYSLGVSQLTRFGLQGKLSYNLSHTALSDVNPLFIAEPSYYEVRPTLELIQSLWRNAWGTETTAQEKVVSAQALGTSFLEAFKAKQWLVEAEGAYWGLSAAREMVAVQKDSLDRALRIKDWSARRVRLGLADRSDLLQAEAALLVRKLEWQASIDEEGSASRQFNSFRGLQSSEVSESLPPMRHDLGKDVSMPTRAGMRLDVKAAEQLNRLAEANAELSRHRNLPQLDLSASFSLNGKDTELGAVVAQSIKTDKPSVAVGMKFLTPLDVGTLSDNRSGYEKEKKGAHLNFQRKVFEQDQQWNDLTTKFTDAKTRLGLAFEIEKAQKEKLDYEKDRHSRGRTTTYHVLMFEQDFALAQAMRIKAQVEILRISALMKLFSNDT